jgi:hypothetical protein
MSTVNAYSGDTASSLEASEAPAQTRNRAWTGRIERNSPHAAALASLAFAYALSWAELDLAATIGLPGDTGSHPLAASVVARVLVGLLYLCVATRLQWARWVTVALGFASVALVAPTLALQWETFPAAAVVSGVALVCRLSASLFLLAPSADVEVSKKAGIA